MNQYCELNKQIGELQVPANETRLDVSFAADHLVRSLAYPAKEHITVARHIWIYINRIRDKALVFKMNSDGLQTRAYSE